MDRKRFFLSLGGLAAAPIAIAGKQETAFEKRLREAKIPPKQHDGDLGYAGHMPSQPYIVRGVPKDARNFKLHVRLESIVHISIMQANGKVITVFAQFNKYGEFYPDFNYVVASNA